MKTFNDMPWDESGIAPDYEAKIRIKLIEPMLGTVPTDPDVYTNHIVGKTRKVLAQKNLDPEMRKQAEEMLDIKEREEIETLPESDEKGFTSFHRDEVTGELFLYDYMIRGFLKAAAGALKDKLKVKTGKIKDGQEVESDLTNYKGRIDSFVFAYPRRILLGKKEADGVLERPLRAETKQGPRVCLAKSDLIAAGTEFEFTVKVLSQMKMSEKNLRELLRYGMYKGLGQFRNGSYGRFVFKMMLVE